MSRTNDVYNRERLELMRSLSKYRVRRDRIQKLIKLLNISISVCMGVIVGNLFIAKIDTIVFSGVLVMLVVSIFVSMCMQVSKLTLDNTIMHYESRLDKYD